MSNVQDFFPCPGCGQPSGMIIGATQALCTTETGCRVVTFNPSLPDGGFAAGVNVIDVSHLEKMMGNGDEPVPPGDQGSH